MWKSGIFNQSFTEAGGMSLNDCSLVTMNNVTIQNSSAASGSALSIEEGSLIASNLTITGNVGDGIYVSKCQRASERESEKEREKR